MEHKHAPRLLIVDLTPAEKVLLDLERDARCSIYRARLLDHVVEYLNKPVQAFMGMYATAQFLADHVIEPRIPSIRNGKLVECDRYEELTIRTQAMVDFIRACDTIFRVNGLYIDQRLHYVYHEHSGPSRVLLAKRPIPIY